MLCPPLSSSNNKLGSNDTNNNGNSFNNNTIKQHNYEKSMTATRREIKSRNIGSLSPLCQGTTTTTLNGANNAPITTTLTSPLAQSLSDRRQASSMEHLVHHQQPFSNSINIQSIRNTNGTSGSNCTISSGKENGTPTTPSESNTSIDESSTDEPPTGGATGLTRSASRVSRFKSAKEFFERLSSVNNTTPSRLEKPPPMTDRPRGNVANRYTAATTAKAASHANLTNITSSPRSRLLPLAPFTRPIVDTTRSVSNIDIHRYSESPQSPKSITNSIVFEGDNVIVGNGSLLNKRNKQLTIQFDESSTYTFEYPSEEALLADSESPSESPVPPTNTNSSITTTTSNNNNKPNNTSYAQKCK